VRKARGEEREKPISTGGKTRKPVGQFAVDIASENTGQRIFQTEVMLLSFLETPAFEKSSRNVWINVLPLSFLSFWIRVRAEFFIKNPCPVVRNE